MKIVYKPRRMGKTYDLLTEVLGNPNAIMIVFKHTEKTRIIAEYCKNDVDMKTILESKIFTYGEYKQGFTRGRALGREEIYIDNLDLFLYDLFSREVKTVTINSDE